jgi:hypothetical protein
MPLDDFEQGLYQDQLDGIPSGITPTTRAYTPPAPSSRTVSHYQPPVRPPTQSIEDIAGYDPNGESFGFRPPDTAPEDHGLYFSDFAKTAWNGARSMGADLMGAAAYATQQLSSDPDSQNIFRRAQQSLEHDIEASIQSMTPGARKATLTSLFSDDPKAPSIDSFGDAARYAAINLTAQIPMLLSFVLPSSIGAKVALTAAKYAGTAEKAVAAATAAGKTAEEIAAAGKAALGTVATRGGMAGSGAFFGAQGGGAVYNDIVKQVTAASDDEMMQAPGYAENRKQGMSIVAAKEKVIQQTASLLVAAGGVVGAATGAGVSGTLVHGALGTAGRGRLARAGIGAAEGGALMGTQGATNEALSQSAGIQTGLNEEFDPTKVAKMFASGAIPGLFFGAIGGLAHKGPAKGIEDTRDVGQTPPDERAALKEALGPPEAGPGRQIYTEPVGPIPPPQGQFDLQNAPPSIPPGGTQGELLQQVQQANAPGRRMTGEPTPPPQPMNTPTQGMPGARQDELPINQAPPTIVPTTGQGEMFPSLPEANPPRRPGEPPPPPPPGGGGTPAGPPAATSAAAQTAATAAPPVDTARVAAAATQPAAAAVAASKARAPIKPTQGIKRPDMISDLMGMTGRSEDSFKGMSTPQIAMMHARESAKLEGEPRPAGTEAPVKPVETVTPGVGVEPRPDRPGGSLSPQAEATPAEPVGARPAAPSGEAAAGVAPTPGPEPRVTGGFTTAKGSTYKVHEDGTTTRDKAYRPEHGAAEQGPQPRSDRTFYVSEGDVNKLGEFQTRGGPDKVLAQHSSGAWGVKYTSGPGAGKFERRTMTQVSEHPTVGAIPVEVWQDGKRVHFGNKITKVEGEAKAPDTKASVPFMITKAMYRDLAARGYTPEQLLDMKPQEAHDILSKPAAKPAAKAPSKLADVLAIREQKREEPPPGPLRAPAAAEAAAKAKLPEAKPVDAEAVARAKATREAELQAAEKAKKEAAAEKLAQIKERAAEVKAGKARVEARKIQAMRAASGERFAVETERGARTAETEDRVAETSGSTTELEGVAEHRAAEEGETVPTAHEGEAGEAPIATQVFGEAKEKERAAGTTDRERIQNDLVDKVASGEITGPEAHAEYELDRRQGGRQRREGYDTIAEGLTRRLEQAKNKELELELLRQQQEHERAPDPELSPRQKQHRTEELHELLSHFDPERIENLENALKAINDPVGHAVENASIPKSQIEKHVAKVEAGGGHTRSVLRAMYEIEGLGARLPEGATAEDRARYENAILHRRGVTPEDIEVIHKRLEALPKRTRAQIEAELERRHGLGGVLRQEGVRPEGLRDPLASRYVRMANDPRLHEDLRRDIRASEEHGVDYTPKAALETILRSSALKTEQRPLWELARKLYDRVNDNIPIISFGEAVRRGYRSIHYNLESGPRGTHGYYTHEGMRSDGQRHIGINLDTPSTAQTILHEIAHSVTTDRLNNLLKTDPNHRELHALRTIGTELANHARLNRETVDPRVWNLLRHATSDVREVHTWLMTNPEVQAFAASKQASPQFRRIMSQLGYEPRKQGNSIWRYFVDWTRHALGFDKPKSASEYTLLDHIMQPVTDILDESIKHNERVNPSDPVLRAHAEPLRQASVDYLRDAGRGIVERIRPSNLPDRLRNAVYGATNVDALTSFHKDILPGLEDYRRIRDTIARTGTEAAQRFGDATRALIKQWGKLSDQKELGQLMNKASIGEMHLGEGVKPDANAHLKSPEQQAELRSAQAEYAKLSSGAKDFYNKARDLYKQFYKETREAELSGSLKSVIPDVTPDQQSAFVHALRNQESLEAYMKDPDNSEIAKAFGTKWAENRDLAKIVAKAHSYGYTKGDYFPQRRYGKYVVHYGTDENRGVEFFDRKSKALDRRAELVKQYGEKDVWQVTRHNQKFTKDILATHPAVGELESALARKGFTAAQAEHARDVLASILVNHMSDTQAARQRLRRQGIVGAETNHSRVLANEFVNHVNRLGYLRHGAERQATLDNLWAQQRDLERPGADPGDATRAAMVIQSLEKRIQRPEDMNNSVQRNLAHVNAFNYAMSLMSPSHMVTSTMEAHTNSIALLGGRHGIFRATSAVARNLARAAPVLGKSGDGMLQAMRHNLQSSNWNVLDMLTKQFQDAPGANKAHIQALHDMLAQSGVIDHTQMSDMRRQMNPDGVFDGKIAGMWERVADTNAIVAHYVDAINRYVSAKSAFDLELAKNKGDVAGAIEYAEKTARRVAPNYTSGNRELLTSPMGPLKWAGAPLMQFKRYGLHMYAMMGTLVKESMRAGTSAERWEARKSLAYLMGTHAMMAGVLGLPTTDAIRYLGGAWDLFHGRAPHNYENSMRGAIASVFGKTAGELISRGLPHALGFDVHRRVALNNLLEMPELSNFGAKGIGEVLMHLVTGATGDNLTKAVEGATKLLQGDLGGTRALIPRIVRDPMDAINLARKGVVDSKGHTILPPSKISYSDVGLRAVGFNPARVSETREGRAAVLEARQEQSAERSQLTTSWLEGSPADRAAAWQAIVAYNAANPHARITREQLLQQEKASKKSSATFGLRLPKQSAAALMGAGAFANAP